MSTDTSNRRTFLKLATPALACTIAPALRAAPPAFKMLETKVISWLPDRYHGWPTLAQRASGELLLVYSGGRDAHICPFGRLDLQRSRDGGRTWTYPRTLLDGPIDERDAGLLETAKGSILVSTFTSLAYQRSYPKQPKDVAARWYAAHLRLGDKERQEALGTWMIRSTDGGVTFSPPYRVPVSSSHGPIQLSDGRLLYAGRAISTKNERVGVCESTDDGQSWQWLSDIPTREGDPHTDYHELHAVETTDGRIVVHIRNHNARNSRETLQCESSDGGKTWSKPHSIGVWGLPSHLLRLRNGRLLMSYGYRREPFGNQARISEDGGRTWSDPITLSADGMGVDLGYPSTVELENGRLVTVWYELMANSPYAVLRQATWELA